MIAVSDVNGGVFYPYGLDVNALRAYVLTHGSIAGFPQGEPISNADLLELDCEVLMPCAMENQITASNAPRVKAKIVTEGANGPLTPEADLILQAKGVFVIPDILCNAGGVTVSYFEWLKNLSNVRFGRMGKRAEEASLRRIVDTIEKTTGQSISAKERQFLIHGADEVDLVRSGLEDTMINAYETIREAKDAKKLPDLRTAAFVSAIEKVAVSYMELGIFP